MGLFKKIEGALTRDVQTEALLQQLLSLNVEAELIDREPSGSWPWKHMVKLEEQNIDAIAVAERNAPSYPTPAHWFHVHYLVFGMRAELAGRLEAKTKEIKEHKFWGKVRNVSWVGGPVAQSLNSDGDLLQLQIEEGQTKIHIVPDKRNQWVHISSPPAGDWSELLPSKGCLNLYNRIAQHVRNYMAQ